VLIRFFAAAFAATSLAACATVDPTLKEQPGFVAGFADGCETAREQSKSFSTRRVRDAEAFDEDAAYRTGWRQGNQECDDPLPPPSDGGRVLGNEAGF
jgi:hypothetical protein